MFICDLVSVWKPGSIFGCRLSYVSRAAREAWQVNDSATVFGDLGIDKAAAVRHQSFECFLLVPAHQPRVSRNIDGEDGG
jgi:hypothetical protein